MEHFKIQRIPVLVFPETKLDQSSQGANPKNSGFNLLILGLDSWQEGSGRTDLIMLVSVNPKSKKINLVSIPRDTRILSPDVGYTKINHTYALGNQKEGIAKGTQASLQAVSSLFQANINYYVTINFSSFVHLVDYLGGLEISLEKPVKLTSTDIVLPATEQLLDGKMVLRLAWERKSLELGDFARQEHQLLIIKALVSKLLQQSLAQLPQTLKEAKGVVDTNFTEKEMLSLAILLKGISTEDIEFIQTPGVGGYFNDPIVGRELYYWSPDLEQVRLISEQYLVH